MVVETVDVNVVGVGVGVGGGLNFAAVAVTAASAAAAAADVASAVSAVPVGNYRETGPLSGIGITSRSRTPFHDG